MEDEARDRGPLFGDVAFTIIPSDDIFPTQRSGIIELAQHGGGRFVPLEQIENGATEVDELTHIISTSIDFPRYTEALGKGVYVVKPGWIINSANKGKLADTRPYSPDPDQFFQDVVVTTAGLPEGDKDAIIAGVLALGGMYSANLSRLVTHLVTNDMNNQKAEIAEEKQLACKILLPHWFDDCLKLGRKINERPYLLPDPEILRKHSSKIRDVPSPQIEGATMAKPTDAPPSSAPSSSPSQQRKDLNVFMSKKVMMCDDLELSEHLLHTLQQLIEYAGATLTADVDEADIFIGHYREGNGYVKASRVKKVVGNLSWLYQVLNRNKWSSPTSKLLHYPIPRQPLPGFADMKISISNYNGEARTYLENLIRHCGAEFTKTMKQTNTHLITAHKQSEKCDAAQEWNIDLVNHIWLEESYAKCEVQTLSNPRYTHFPARTNLGEVVGQTSFDMQRMEQMYFPEPRKTPSKAVQSKANAKPTQPATTLQATAVLADEATPEPSTAKKGRGRPPRSAATPRIRDVVNDEKENESPSLHSSGRASKLKANANIHASAGDIAQFQKEMKRKGGVTHGGRRASHAEDFSSPAPPSAEEKTRRKKRPSDEATYDVTAQGSDLSDGETQAQQKPAKKAKTKSSTPAVELPPVQYKMMVTGDERWLDKANKESQDRSTLRQLGVRLTQDAKDVDILVAPKILRTRKFVCALASAPLVVDTAYLDYALKQKALKESPSVLQDRDAEERLGFKLSKAIERAKINNRKLLRGWHIFITKDVAPGFDTYKEIVTLNGGSAYLYQGRTGVTIPKRRIRDDPDAGEESQHQGADDEFDYVYLVSGVSGPEQKLWKSFSELVKKQGLEARVVKNDWLLYAAMSQEVKWRDEYGLEEQ